MHESQQSQPTPLCWASRRANASDLWHTFNQIGSPSRLQVHVPLHGCREAEEKTNGAVHNQLGIDTKHNQAEHAEQRTLIVRYVLTAIVMRLSCDEGEEGLVVRARGQPSGVAFNTETRLAQVSHRHPLRMSLGFFPLGSPLAYFRQSFPILWKLNGN